MPSLMLSSPGIRTLPLPGMGEGNTSQRKMYILVSDREGKVKEFSLYICCFSAVQLKVILMPKGHVSGWDIMIPFKSQEFSIWPSDRGHAYGTSKEGSVTGSVTVGAWRKESLRLAVCVRGWSPTGLLGAGL